MPKKVFAYEYMCAGWLYKIIKYNRFSTFHLLLLLLQLRHVLTYLKY